MLLLPTVGKCLCECPSLQSLNQLTDVYVTWSQHTAIHLLLTKITMSEVRNCEVEVTVESLVVGSEIMRENVP